MTNLPQKWQFHNVQFDNGVAASIVIPAGRGLSHVLTDINAIAGASAGGPDALILEVLDGATLLFSWVLLVPESNGPPVSTGTDSFNQGELNLIGTVNTTMTIQFTAGIGVATSVEQIIAQGYDL